MTNASLAPSAFAEFVRGLPKAELHMHIEGSLEPELMFALAKRNGITLPFASVEEIRAAYDFSNLQDFLDIYYQGAGVLITEADFKDLTLAYFQRLAADGGTHAEIFFDPQTHTDRGIAFDTVMNGLLAGMDEAEKTLGVTSKLILCFLRHLSEDAAFETLEQAKPWLSRLAGVGLEVMNKATNTPQQDQVQVGQKILAEIAASSENEGEKALSAMAPTALPPTKSC